MDYGSLIELNTSPVGEYLLDAEVMRLEVAGSRDLGERYFVEARATIGSAGAGFMDGFFHWYHNLLGFHMPERDLRPRDRFAYQLGLPDGSLQIHRAEAYLGDTRLTVGRRLGPKLQTVLTISLPTGTGGAAYASGVTSLASITTWRAVVTPRLGYEGSFGLGFTPKHGEMRAYQKDILTSLSSGFRWRIWGRQFLFANLLYHSPYYINTNYPGLDRIDLSLNYGWILRGQGGTEWKVGMTEDPSPSGPAIDAVFQFAASW